MIKKIMIVLPSFAGGGAEKVGINLANFYASNGFDVVLVVFSSFGPYADQVSSSVRVVDLKSKRIRFSFLRYIKTALKENPDVVLSVMRDSNIIVGLSSFFTGNKIFFREANTMEGVLSKKWSWVYRIIMMLSYWRANGVITNSEGTKNDLILYKIVAERKCTTIGNPVLPLNFQALIHEENNDPWIKHKSGPLILNIGRLTKAKNQLLLIQAFSIFLKKKPDAKLMIVGVGDEYENLCTAVSQLGISNSVRIVGFLSNPYPLYRAADVFVLTSRWEGFGNVLVEAMACGTAVISTDCAGPKSILKEGMYGRLISRNSTNQSLAEELCLFFDTIEKKSAGGNELKNRAMEYSVASIAKKYMEVMSS